MKKWTILLTLMLLIPLVTAIQECNDVMTQREVPCIIKSAWSYSSCTLTQVKIYNSTPTLLDTRNFTDYGSSGRCNITWNYSSIGSYFWNVTNGDSGHIIVEYESDTMASMAIMLLVMAITAAVFWIGYRVRFTENEIANVIIRRSCYLGGVWLLILDLTIAVTISDNFGLGTNQILFRFLWFAHKGALIYTMVLVITSIFLTLSMWKIQKQQRRMGYG